MLFYLYLLSLGEDDQKLVLTIYETYRQKIYAIALDIVGDREDAQDVSQTVMLNVMKNLDKFRTADKTDTENQLYVYTRNAAINRYNKNKKRREREDVYTEADDVGADDGFSLDELQSIENIVITKETVAIVRDALQKLPETLRDAINLVYLEGYSLSEAAKILKTTPGTVSKRLTRAKKKLLEGYGKELYERIAKE